MKNIVNKIEKEPIEFWGDWLRLHLNNISDFDENLKHNTFLF